MSTIRDRFHERKIKSAVKENKQLLEEFDEEYYLEANPDVKASGIDPLFHYVTAGIKEGRFPNKSCEESMENRGYERWTMLPRRKGIRRLVNDWKNIRTILESGEFDGSWYLSQYQEVNEHYTQKRIWKYRYKKNPVLRLAARILTNACVHYVTKGVYMGYSPNAFFDTVYYMNHNLDLCKNAGLNPFVHYLRFGKKEGRACGGGNSLTDIWIREFEDREEQAGVSIVTPSKSFLPLKESEYEEYGIEVIEAAGHYVKNMGKCHKEVVWFLEDTCDIELFTGILAGRKYFTDPSVFAVCAQGQDEFLVASDRMEVDGMYPCCLRFEPDTMLLRKGQCLLSDEKPCSFNTLAHYITSGAKIVFTNVSGKPLEKMDHEEFSSVYEISGSRCCTGPGQVRNLYREMRNAALAADVPGEDWERENRLDAMTADIRTPRILISIYAFSYGGGEIMPIRLANALWEKGYQTGVHVYNFRECHADVRSRLNPSIPVIYADSISAMITQVDELGYNIINTHHQACQSFIDQVLAHDENLQKRVSHIATSHGMYEDFEPDVLETILQQNDMVNRVSYWTYVADKNIQPFERLNVYDRERFVKIPNGMQMPEIQPFDLSAYGITKDDFVITVISRALVEKGWLHAIHAVEKLHDSHPEIHLLLVGNGEVYDQYAEKLGNEYIHFLGFRDNPCDIFAVSQLCLLPSYYPSESAPLCLIEAMMCEIPSVATDIGDVREMLSVGDKTAGKVISLKQYHVDEEELADAIRELVEDKEVYESAVLAAGQKRAAYRMESVADQYVCVYRRGIAGIWENTEYREQFETMVERERKTDTMLWNAKRGADTPKVSVIVPNYNHSKFLRQRLDSIYGQSYQNLEVILMDDCSTDDSREILEEYAAKYPEKTKLLFNEENSGGVFYQWTKGIRNASGELCWIAESDDYCEHNFLETLVPEFGDANIRLAYTKYVFVNEKGEKDQNGFWNYMGKVDRDKWRHSYRNTAIREIGGGLGIINTIPNASGAVFRNPGEIALFSDSDWYQMKICGDWIFYMHLIKDGNIAYNVGTTSYFRFHSNNSSAKTYTQPVYYKEHGQVAECLWDLYHPDDEIMSRQKEMVWNFYQQNVGSDRDQFERWYDFRLEDKTGSASPEVEKAIRTMGERIRGNEEGAPAKMLLLDPIDGLKNRTPQNTLEESMALVGNNTGNQVFVEAVRQQVNVSAQVWTHPAKVKMFDTGDTVAVMPCSNYIIEGPMPYVRSLVDLYENTDFPIVPIGLGAQSSQAGSTPRKLVQRLQQHVVTWLKMASERTVSIGIRGEFTAECLDLLGIHNYRVIGCPTLYQYLDGKYPVLPKPSVEKTLFTTTAKSEKEAKMLRMAMKSDSKWILQMMTEYPEILYNDSVPDRSTLERYFPGLQVESAQWQAFVKKNAGIFFDFDEWNAYLQNEKFTFAYGSRFHGNMMALRNGIPALWITHDSRTSELVNTLHLPHVSIDEALKARSPKELLPFCDYSGFYRVWPGMVREYVNFLEENHIDHRFTL